LKKNQHPSIDPGHCLVTAAIKQCPGSINFQRKQLCMRHFFNEFFYYTAAERAGILGLLFLCVVLASGSCWLPWLLQKPAAEGASLPAFPAAWAAAAGTDTIRVRPGGRVDVNAPTYASLRALGLPPASIRAWMGYVKKGGRFRRPADLARFRGLAAADRERIMPQLIFPETHKRRPPAARPPETSPPPLLFAFDPNTATVAELRQLGLSERLANNLQRYRDKGGRFRKAEDLQRLYGLAPADYERLRPFVQIAESAEKSAPPSRQPPPPTLLDVNTADAAAWEQLRGIGPALSRRIVGFRDRLGGFSSLAQIAETYGLPDSTYQRLLPQLQWSPVYRPLLVNVYGAEELGRHPYLDRRSAAAIVHYRNQHGPFRQPGDLRNVLALDKATVDKLLPYISCAAQADD